ncbi:MAG: MFS transporter, partial [Rhodovibrionaceae bacterium]
LEGLAFAVLAIAGPTLTNLSASARALPIVLGLTAAWIPIGQISATLLAQPALSGWGWQSLWIAGALGCALLALWTLGMRRSLPQGTAASAAQEQGAAILAPRERWLLALGGFGFLVFSGQYFAYMTWMPQYLVEVQGFSLDGAVWGYLLPVVVLMIFNIVAGRILQAGVSVGGLLTAALALQAAVWWLLPWTGSDWTGLVSVVAYGIGAGVAPTCLFSLPSTILGPGRGAAAAYGLMMTGRSIGVFIGPILLAEAFKLSGGWDLSAPIFGSFTTAGALGALWLWLSLRNR